MSAAAAAERARWDAAREELALSERCAGLCGRALARGADEAEAYGVRSRSISIAFEKGDLKLAKVDESSSIGLRVFRGRRLGFASTNQGGTAALDAAAEDALALSRSAPPDEHNVLPAARPVAPRLAGIEDELAELPVERVVELGRRLVAAARARDRRISIDNASCTLAVSSRAIATSRGAAAAESDAQLGLSIFGMAVDGAEVGGFHYDGDALRRVADVEPALERVAAGFATIALENLHAGRAESYRGPVLFAPDALLEVFVGPLCSAASAIAVQRGRSALAGRLGQRIASDSLDVVDDPTDRSLAGACGFDREGQPVSRFPLVERGVLRSFLYNGYAATVEGRRSTGHARGGARSTPGLGVHALQVAPGEGGDAGRMLAALGRGLLVRRFSGTVDPASGDFSGVAKSARWVEGGAQRPVRETLLSGNVFELLLRLVALSSEVERCGGAALAPWALVDGVSVTAG